MTRDHSRRRIVGLAALVLAGLVSAHPAGAEYTLTTLVNFDGANGDSPEAGLIRDAQGNLYGTTYYGGAFGQGTVFELPAGSSTPTTLASFNGANGDRPYGGLIRDAQGNLYGATYYGGVSNRGTVFVVPVGSGRAATVATFDGANGANPHGDLIMDARGNLYGTTEVGGAFNRGTVFEVAAGGSTITSLASFNGANGAYPRAGLIMDAQGNLYGTTHTGGAFDRGTVFVVPVGSGRAATVATFDGANGAYPEAPLIRDARGNLYGTTAGTYLGLGSSSGTVFVVPVGSGRAATVATFDGANGAAPRAGLIMDARGNLYGTTYFGGAFGQGTVFELPAGSSTLTTLASFDGYPDGHNPLFSGVIMDAQGNLYGTTSLGGAYSDRGTVFELVVPEPAAWLILSQGLLLAGGLFVRARCRV